MDWDDIWDQKFVNDFLDDMKEIIFEVFLNMNMFMLWIFYPSEICGLKEGDDYS